MKISHITLTLISAILLLVGVAFATDKFGGSDDEVRVETNGTGVNINNGAVRVNDGSGTSVDVNGGAVRVNDGSGSSVDVRNSGTVRVNDGTANVEIDNGDISVDDGAGSSVDINDEGINVDTGDYEVEVPRW